MSSDRRTRWNAAELIAAQFPEPRWAVPGLLAEGLSLLVGAPKLGKSWLALNLGIAVSNGGVALGNVRVEQGDVLYLALEDNGRRLQNRLRMVLKGAPAPSRLWLETVCEPLLNGGDKLIEQWLNENPDARLVVVDVFTRIRGRAFGDKSNQYDTDYDAMAALKEIADTHGVAMLAVHHSRKAEATDFLDAVSGTQGLAGAADAVLVLQRSRGAAAAVLKMTGRDIEEAEHALTFDAACGTWRKLDGPASDYELSEERRSIIAALRAQDGLAPKQIAEVTSVSYDVIRHLVGRMVEAGQIDTDGSGHYLSIPLHSVHSVHTQDQTSEQSE